MSWTRLDAARTQKNASTFWRWECGEYSTILEYWSTAHCPWRTMYTECVGLHSTSFARFVQFGNLSRVRLPEALVHAFISSRLDYCNSLFMELISHYWTSCKPFCVPLPDWSWRNSNSIIFPMTFVTSCTGCLSSRESASTSACMYAGVLTMRHLLTCPTCSLPSRMSMLWGVIVPPIEPTWSFQEQKQCAMAIGVLRCLGRDWNALPAELKTPNISLLDFKRGLKTMLFKQAFAWFLNCSAQAPSWWSRHKRAPRKNFITLHYITFVKYVRPLYCIVLDAIIWPGHKLSKEVLHWLVIPLHFSAIIIYSSFSTS